MPHECTDCGRAFEDGSKEMLSGCPECGGTTFQFRPDGPEPSEESDDAPEPPGPGVDGVARTVGNAASTVRNLVAGGRRSDDDPGPDGESGEDSRTASASPERDRPGATEDPVDAGTVANTSADPDQSQTTGEMVGTETADTGNTSRPDDESAATEGTEHTEQAGPAEGVEATGGVERTEQAGPAEGVEATGGVERTEQAGPAEEVDSSEATPSSDAASRDQTDDGLGQSSGSSNGGATDEGTGVPDPMEADWPGTDEEKHRSTAGSDTAQSNSGDGIVEADETGPAPGNDRDRPPVPDPRPLSARSEDGTESEGVETDTQSKADGTGDGTGEEPEDRPSLSELRAELNDQFESIRVVAPGQYELNLMELYDREEYIVALREDGKYTVQIPDRWE